jgi:hypothetical protein
MSEDKIATALLDELWDAGFKLNGPECDKVDEIGRRIEGERAVLVELLGECYNIIASIEPEDGDEAEQLRAVLDAIERTQPGNAQGCAQGELL